MGRGREPSRWRPSVFDRRLQVAIDGRLLFDPYRLRRPAAGGPGRARARSRSGCAAGALEVSELRIYRDIYYTSSLANTPRQPHGMSIGRARSGPDEYFVLGDNSPVSNDSRFWTEGPVVPRLDVPGQAVPGPPARPGRPAPGLRAVGVLGSRSSANPLHSIAGSSRAGRWSRPAPRSSGRRESMHVTTGSRPSSSPGELEEREHETMGRSSATLQASARACHGRSSRPQPKEGHRDTVEAIVVAFILALVVRGFEAQAFVIPTGSMAPTLMGRHKEIACPQCGFVYAVNASRGGRGSVRRPSSVYSGHLRQLPVPGARLDDAPSFKGDRILVMMFPYDLPFLPGQPAARSAGTSSSSAIPRSRRSATSSAWSACPARRSGSSTATSTSRRREATISRWPASRCDTSRRCRSSSTTIAIGPRRLAGSAGVAAVAAATTGGWKLVDPTVEPISSRRQRRRTSGPSCGIATSSPIPSSGTRSQDDRALPRPPRATLITDFYSYNTNLSADCSNLLDDVQREIRKAHGCSRTGSAT